MIKLRIGCYLIWIFQMCLGTMVEMIENGHVMDKTNLKVQVHQSWIFSSPAAWEYFIGKAITPSFGVSLRSMSTWWKAYLIRFQMDLVWSQYHVGKATKSSRHAVAAGSYVVVMGLLFTLGTQAQVGAHPKEMENKPRKPLDVLLLGHLLRRPARASKPSRKPSPTRVRVCLGLEDQSIIKETARKHSDFIFKNPYMDGKLIW